MIGGTKKGNGDDTDSGDGDDTARSDGGDIDNSDDGSSEFGGNSMSLAMLLMMLEVEP